MPNHCEQTTIITGPRDERDRFVDSAKDEDGRFSLSVFHPMPEGLKGSFSGFTSDPEKAKEYAEQHASNLAEYGYANWYDWANAEWGTKWGDYDGEVTSNDEHSTTAIYLSAWGPASELLAKVSALFPTLLFVTRYVDEGWGFSGVTAHRGGELLEDRGVEIPEQDFSSEDEEWERKQEEWEWSWMRELDEAEDDMEAKWGEVAA